MSETAEPLNGPPLAQAREPIPPADATQPASAAAFCTRCGMAPEAADHTACRRWLASEEPPRFCARCARRMKVQIIPTGWSAECTRHGALSGGAGV